MSRLNDIKELILTRESKYSQSWVEDMADWMQDREDAEIVELMRSAASTLAYRSVSNLANPYIGPSYEVFKTAMLDIAKTFEEGIRVIVNDDK